MNKYEAGLRIWQSGLWRCSKFYHRIFTVVIGGVAISGYVSLNTEGEGSSGQQATVFH